MFTGVQLHFRTIPKTCVCLGIQHSVYINVQMGDNAAVQLF